MNRTKPHDPWSTAAWRDPNAGWRAFIEQFGPRLLQVARFHARNDEQGQDCFLYICEKLCARRFRRLRQFNPDQGVPFESWLITVCNNLGRDWRRAEFGRLRTPRAIRKLGELDQRVFHLTYRDRLDRQACLQALSSEFSDLTAADLALSLQRVHQSLSAQQRWRLSFGARNPDLRQISLQSGFVSLQSAETGEPLVIAEDAEQKRRLESALKQLDSEQRLLIRLRFEEMLSFDELAGAMGYSNLHAARRRVEETLARLRQLLSGE